MMLTWIALGVLAWLGLRCVLPLSWGLPAKAALMTVGLLVCLKFTVYTRVGGAFFAPDLPRPLLVLYEAAFAGLMLLFALVCLKDLFLGLLWLGRRLGLFTLTWPFSSPATHGGLLILALVLSSLGVWQAIKVPEVRTVDITLPRLPKALEGFTVVQLSDLHVGPFQKRDWLSAVVERVNALQPDAVVLTGDLIDGLPEQTGPEITPLADLRAPCGVYAVPGNHEHYFGGSAWYPLLERLGVQVLVNSHRVMTKNGAQLVVAGLEDPVVTRYGKSGPDLEAALNGAPEAPRLLLAHRPNGVDKTPSPGIDLQLSGHTHGGLILGLDAIIALYNEGLVHGLYQLGPLQLYVSPGTGVWNGFSCRLGIPSEITRLVLHAGTK